MLIPPVGPSEGTQPSQLRLFDGQIFKGKVLGLLNNDTEVLVEVGGRVVKSDVEVPVEAGKSYLFQFLNQRDRALLKIINTVTSNESGGTTNNFAELIQKLSLPNTKQTTTLLNFFLDKDLPIQASLIRSVQRMVGGSHLNEADLDVIEQMIRHQLPLDASLFRQLSAFKSTPQPSESLNQLMTMLQTSGELASPNAAKLAEFLSTWPNLDQHPADNWLYDILNRMGYFHEGRLFQSAPDHKPDVSQSLKTLLLFLLSEEGENSDKNLFQNLLTTITGQQLQSVHIDRSLVQYLFTLPLLFQHQFKDVQLLWERKNQDDHEEGQAIDYHNILFAFAFSNLGDTVIKILVQGKTLTVTLYNDERDLTEVLEHYRPLITQKLAELDYRLVSLRQTTGQLEQMKNLFKGNQQAMDVRI
ncbi:hypothetical protein GCM10011391_21000 [Pullulanibacillus camelliae]|uniref:Flagellar hook-length control protein FliK n=1 Tax=Pullulanibacillus camelliae TaxID=1707096 RepID=A0A8J2YGW5_9BACL|nr:hypothetical protein [Pullulanibacillus camelliae]GGE42022.1 hypothetical protein GCM10011391_21000 [Pullulanibacillus camelliae]